MRAQPASRPRFLNLFRIRYPIGAVASIAHRISGLLLLVSLPALVNGLDYSLRSESNFLTLRAWLAAPWATAILAVAGWGLVHHLAAGVRHLLMDAGIGTALSQARRSARAVILLGLLAAVAILLKGLA
jgi:succinate dehydrogenase / fumarate reductase, cytochrome b subunit